ncbi:MAG TPA: type II toxin-antitoxin system prevent-host-death family antitoxin [Chthoniobacterales bacterium]
MKIINIQEAKTHLSRLVEEALAGEELVIAKAGKPLVKLVPFQATKPRVLGALRGQIWESPDCWDPDPELEKLFYESDLHLDEPKIAEDPL